MKASICIFQSSAEDSVKPISTPEVPDEIFSAIKSVIETKNEQVIKHRTGTYIIQYSETGPFQKKLDDWLPVKVTKVIQWASGGVKTEEMAEFDRSQQI
jgi:hypothetical protein